MDGVGEQRGRREEEKKVGGERKSKPKAEEWGEWKKMGRNLFDFGRGAVAPGENTQVGREEGNKENDERGKP